MPEFVFITTIAIIMANGQAVNDTGAFETMDQCQKAYKSVVKRARNDPDVVGYIISPCVKTAVIFKKVGKGATL